MSDQAESPDDAFWYSWEEGEPENGWLLSYVDVLSVILAMLLVLLVSQLESGEQLPQPATVESAAGHTAPTPLPAALPGAAKVGPERPNPASLHPPLTASLPPPLPSLRPMPVADAATEPTGLPDTESKAEAELVTASIDTNGVVVVHHDQGITLQIPEVVLFDSSEAELKASADAALTRALLLLREFEDAEVAVQGHTDNRPLRGGEYRNNWELASARANAVAEFLLEQAFPADRLRIESYADTQPVADNNTDAGRARNRRVEILVEFEQGGH